MGDRGAGASREWGRTDTDPGLNGQRDGESASGHGQTSEQTVANGPTGSLDGTVKVGCSSGRGGTGHSRSGLKN